MTKENIGWLDILAYRDFYDVPRAFVVEPSKGQLMFFDCPFDDKIDDYPDWFKVSVFLAGVHVSDLPNDWRDLHESIARTIGAVPISAVHFDTTRRKRVLVDGLANLIAAAEQVVQSDTA